MFPSPKVQYQETLSSAFLGALARSEAYFQTKEQIWKASITSFLMEISNVHKKGDDVIALLDQTKVCSILCYKKN